MPVVHPRVVRCLDDIIDGLHYIPEPLWDQLDTSRSIWDNIQPVSFPYRAHPKADDRLWQHHRTVPALYAFNLLGIEGTNKSFMYMLAIIVCPYRISLLTLARGFITTYIDHSSLDRSKRRIPISDRYSDPPPSVPPAGFQTSQIVSYPSIHLHALRSLVRPSSLVFSKVQDAQSPARPSGR